MGNCLTNQMACHGVTMWKLLKAITIFMKGDKAEHVEVDIDGTKMIINRYNDSDEDIVLRIGDTIVHTDKEHLEDEIRYRL